MNKRLFSIILVVFIDLLGFSLILPLLPYYAETFKASQTTTGILIASYALMQLIGAPILGRLSDRFGRRPVLLLSVFGTFLGFLLLGFANALWMLFVSRIIDGLTGGNLSVAQAYISDVTDAKDRSKGLGMIGAAFGLGFIIGPVTGGLLSQWGYAVPAFAAAAISFINLILIYAWLPESLTEEKRSQMTEKRPAITLNALLVAFQRPFTGSILITRFFFGLAFAIFQTIFSLYALAKFNLTARDTGFVLTYVGVLSVIVQGFLVGRLTSHFREDILITVVCRADGNFPARLGAGSICAMALHHHDSHRALRRIAQHAALQHADQSRRPAGDRRHPRFLRRSRKFHAHHCPASRRRAACNKSAHGRLAYLAQSSWSASAFLFSSRSTTTRSSPR